MPPKKDRRRAPRVTCGGSAKAFGARTVSGVLKDVSRGGVFLQIPLPLFTIGGELTLKFSIPGDARVFEATAEVRYHAHLPAEEGGPGMGLRFVRLPNEAQEAIDAFVAARHSPETEPPWRE